MAKNDLSQYVLGGELPPHSDNKNVVSQVRRYNGWLANTGRRLYQPDLVAYRDHLLATLAPASVKAHLSSIRRSYKLLVESVEHRAALVAYLEAQFPDEDFATINRSQAESPPIVVTNLVWMT